MTDAGGTEDIVVLRGEWGRSGVRSLPSRVPAPRASRHILVGVSHPSEDPTKHRVFEVRAVYDIAAGGWIAGVDEQNQNAQASPWLAWQTGDGQEQPFPTAAACLGHAVELIVGMAACDAVDESGIAARSDRWTWPSAT
jgi:hypothetical protein